MSEKYHPLVAPLIPLVRMLGAALGPDYEIVLHDLSGKEPLIAAIANERLSGRDGAAPLTDFGRFLMSSAEAADLDFLANYPSEAKNGRQMRSSVAMLRDEDGKLVGFLCLNYDMTKAKLLGEMSSFLTAVTPLSFEGVKMEKFGGDGGDEAGMIARASRKMGCPLEFLSSDERKECIRYLDSLGFFKLKGSIDYLAKEMKKSRFTLYADLRAERKKKGTQR
ncbi:MAG: helix-turn-helix transcriptional regulator [Synergistaceae bacterium]|nr:helix-turn-helix transcriptional regulator [Synergistaceae bacterium]